MDDISHLFLFAVLFGFCVAVSTELWSTDLWGSVAGGRVNKWFAGFYRLIMCLRVLGVRAVKHSCQFHITVKRAIFPGGIRNTEEHKSSVPLNAALFRN